MGIIKTGIAIVASAAKVAASEEISNKTKNLMDKGLKKMENKKEKVGKSKTEIETGKELKVENSNENIIECPDCGKFFSIHASACPYCGCPINFILEQSSKNNLVENPKDKKKDTKIVEAGDSTQDKKIKDVGKRQRKFSKEVIFKEDQGRLWAGVLLVSVFLGLVGFIMLMCCIGEAESANRGVLIASIVLLSLTALCIFIGIILTIGPIRSFYVGTYRIDIKDGLFRKKVAVNNEVVYVGLSGSCEVTLPNGVEVAVYISGYSSSIEVI